MKKCPAKRDKIRISNVKNFKFEIAFFGKMDMIKGKGCQKKAYGLLFLP